MKITLEVDHLNHLMKQYVTRYRSDIKLLEDVDRLLGKDVTETKKIDLLNTLSAVQDIQQDILDLAGNELHKRENEIMVDRMKQGCRL